MLERTRELIGRSIFLSGPKNVLATLSATWRRGFLQSVRAPNWEGLRMLLTHPSGALLEELVLDNPRLAMDEQLDLVATARPPLLRIVVRSDDGDTQFRGLIDGGGALRLPTLTEASFAVRALALGGRGAERSSVTRLEISLPNVAMWPRLSVWHFPQQRSLELSNVMDPVFSGSHRFGSPRDRRLNVTNITEERFAAGLAAPALEELRLAGFVIGQSTASFFVALATHTPLRVLDLRQCRLESGAELLGTLTCSVLLPLPKEP